MTTYVIGDLQGCHEPLQRLLDHLQFDPTADRLWCVGDLVNRGPDSRGVLQTLQALGTSAVCVLGNHDLHLLALAAGVRAPGRKDTLDDILAAPERDDWIEWLRNRPLAHLETVAGQPVLMVHAGVLPQWTLDEVPKFAQEVERVLSGPDWRHFLSEMYGDEPRRWDPSLSGVSRLRVIVNALTRLRFCDAAGTMDFKAKGDETSGPAGYFPWYAVPGRQTEGARIMFGHWSQLKARPAPPLAATDYGCIWGGRLAALALETEHWSFIECPSQGQD